jgi:hypothetical protein
MVWCGRVSEGSIRQNAGGQYLHHRDSSNPVWQQTAQPEHVTHSRKHQPERDWGAFANYLAVDSEQRCSELAEELRVSTQSLIDLGVGWYPQQACWTFPERDANGKVIGINRRFRNGDKKRMSGSKSGLTYACGWNQGNGPICLVEGGSDTAALITIGISGVGRPSNRAGVGLMVDLLFDIPAHREIVVVAERDQKEDGAWPGRDGAISVATQLAEALGRPITWALLPGNAKDARAWLLSMPQLPRKRLENLFVTGLEKSIVLPPPTLTPEAPPREAVGVGDWRASMLQARIESLSNPGLYLDASPTGAGKSWVDIEAVVFALSLETSA